MQPGNARKLGIIAALPDHQFELAELDALEDAGLVVMEVPYDAQSSDDLLEFIESSLEDTDCATHDLIVTYDEPIELEETLLDLLNDPNGE